MGAQIFSGWPVNTHYIRGCPPPYLHDPHIYISGVRFMGAVDAAQNFTYLEYFHKYMTDFKISGGSLNFQIITRYFEKTYFCF